MQIYLIIAITSLVYFVNGQAIQGSIKQQCAQNGACRDADSGCGYAGVESNWTYKAATKSCIVTDCKKLGAQNSKVSDNSCASCNTSNTNSASQTNNAGNIYASSDKSVCVSVNCAELQQTAQMTTTLCQQCLDPKATVNSDNATCSLPTGSKILSISFLVVIVIFIS